MHKGLMPLLLLISFTRGQHRCINRVTACPQVTLRCWDFLRHLSIEVSHQVSQRHALCAVEAGVAGCPAGELTDVCRWEDEWMDGWMSERWRRGGRVVLPVPFTQLRLVVLFALFTHLGCGRQKKSNSVNTVLDSILMPFLRYIHM